MSAPAFVGQPPRSRAVKQASMSEPRSANTIFKIGENCGAVAKAGRAALLVDAANYFEAFMRAAERAQESIIVLAWDFDSRTPLKVGPGGERVAVGEFLNGLARRKRRLHVHIL